MAAPRAKFVVLRDDYLGGGPLVIRDVGPWDEHPTVTNDADAIVVNMLEEGELAPEQRLLYFDSEGELAELLHDGQRFVGFKAAGEGDHERFGELLL